MANQNHMIIDPTGYTPGDIDSTTIYVSGDGILKKSTDGGQNWTNLLTSAGTPPNDAVDSPAPTNTDLTYTRMTYNATTGDLIVQAEWENGASEWRYWLLNKSLADSYTWKSVAGATGLDPDDVGAPSWTVNINPDNESYINNDSVTSLTNAGSGSNPDNTGGLNTPTFKTSVQNGKDLVLFDKTLDESLTFGTNLGKPTEWTIIIACQFDLTNNVADEYDCLFGSHPVSSVGTYTQNGTWGVMANYNYLATTKNHLQFIFGDSTGGFATQNYSQGQIGDVINTGEFTVLAQKHTSGDNFCDQWKDGTLETITNTFRTDVTTTAGTAYATRIGHMGDLTTGASHNGHFDGYIGRILVINSALTDQQVVDYSNFLMVYYGMVATEARPLDLTCDNFSGSHLWTTEWDATNLRLNKRTNTTLALENSVSLGAATEAQIDARTYYAKVFSLGSPSGASDTCFVYGRWGSTVHLAKTTDGAVTIGSNLGDGTWGTQWVSELFALNENTIFAFLAGGTPALWRTDDGGSSWTNLGTLPFDVDSASLSASGIMAICNLDSGTDAQQVAMSESPFSTWTDASTGLDTTGGKKAIRWV